MQVCYLEPQTDLSAGGARECPWQQRPVALTPLASEPPETDVAKKRTVSPFQIWERKSSLVAYGMTAFIEVHTQAGFTSGIRSWGGGSP